MQHLWSMSMQGQFFVATLLGALALGGILKFAALRTPRFGDPQTIRRIVGLALLAVTLVSFLWANYRHAVSQPVNYYDTMARLWEPMAGGLLAVWMPRLVLSRRVRNVLTVGALLLIVTCGWWIKGVEGTRAPWRSSPSVRRCSSSGPGRQPPVPRMRRTSTSTIGATSMPTWRRRSWSGWAASPTRCTSSTGRC